MAIEKAELKFENELIHKLETLGGVKQWKYEATIKTTDQLWSNFKTILEENNRDKLDKPLSKDEFSQVKRIITTLKIHMKLVNFYMALMVCHKLKLI